MEEKYKSRFLQASIFRQKETGIKNCTKVIVVGNRATKELIYCYYLVKGLYKYRKNDFQAPVIRGVTSVEWSRVWNDLNIQYGGETYCLRSEVAVIVNDILIGGEKELKEFLQSKYVYHLCLDYYYEGIQQLHNFINSSDVSMKHERVILPRLIRLFYAETSVDLLPYKDFKWFK